MSILHDHFEKVRRLRVEGANIVDGVFMDMQGTLLMMNGQFNKPLQEFAEWNFKQKFLGDNHVFSSGAMGANMILDFNDFTEETTGVKRVETKKFIYQNVSENKQRLALVIDDKNPAREAISECDIVTWWNPNSREVEEFLEQKLYLDFTP